MDDHDGDDPDWKLLRTAQAGDPDAFASLYRRHRPTVQTYLAARLTDFATVEDLTSETFLRAWRSLPTVGARRGDVPAWFVTIARNLLYDHAKAASRRELLGIQPPLRVDIASPEDHLVRREELRALRGLIAAAIDTLTDDQRGSVRLRFWREFTARETAAALGREPNAAKQLHYRAMRRLADLLVA